ncbi:RNA-directed DNA polymerase (Reverse transcriptase), Ribonuclease H [Gossypium australe]|uniref:RNA-directed DNA polymerase (Reverse transcriptase), Ribonuclease H n=1 Tax=Gossypium australe TaxID=47621 RepID=A0A5B6WL09_9ROSI|nr:RNA-directed DNA polymerase (Reverse transcriptase), Ribonuclease H [Gossypium australe]
MWGMDVIGLISLKAANGHRFIFAIIDYFTNYFICQYHKVDNQQVLEKRNHMSYQKFARPNIILPQNEHCSGGTQNIKQKSKKKTKQKRSWGKRLRLVNIGTKTYHLPSMLIERLPGPSPEQQFSH